MAGRARCCAMTSSVLGQKETDPRGLRGSAGSRKVPDTKIKKATTLVVAQDNLSASSSRTSSPSSLLASVDHLLLATHWRLYRHTHVADVNRRDRKEFRRSSAERHSGGAPRRAVGAPPERRRRFRSRGSPAGSAPRRRDCRRSRCTPRGGSRLVYVRLTQAPGRGTHTASRDNRR